MMWKCLVGIALVPVVAAAIACGIGLMLPRDHVARVKRTFAAPSERVAALVREVEAQPSWRKDIRTISVQERGPDHVRYIESSRHGAVAYDLREEAPGHRFRSTIADANLPFGGYWIIDIAPTSGGTRVEITEHGSVRNPIFRFVSAFVIGYDATAKAYLVNLGRAVETARA